MWSDALRRRPESDELFVVKVGILSDMTAITKGASGLVLALLLLTPGVGYGATASDTTTSSQAATSSKKGIIERIFPFLSPDTQEKVVKVQETQENAESLWGRANGWMEDTVGLSLRQVLRGIGDVVVWVLGVGIEVMQTAAKFLQFVVSFL